jgi:hypothetical protein
MKRRIRIKAATRSFIVSARWCWLKLRPAGRGAWPGVFRLQQRPASAGAEGHCGHRTCKQPTHWPSAGVARAPHKEKCAHEFVLIGRTHVSFHKSGRRPWGRPPPRYRVRPIAKKAHVFCASRYSTSCGQQTSLTILAWITAYRVYNALVCLECMHAIGCASGPCIPRQCLQGNILQATVDTLESQIHIAAYSAPCLSCISRAGTLEVEHLQLDRS